MKRIFCRLTAVLLLLASLFALASCGDYKPVKSSEQEARTMAMLQGEEVRFELLYAFANAFRSDYDHGDLTVWQKEGADTLLAALLGAAMEQISEIYATFRVCEENGIDPYGKAVDKQVNDRVKIDIDGGYTDNTFFEGYGSKKKYLAALEAQHLNDSVNRLLHRWDICLGLLYEKMIDEFDGGANAVTREDVREFYDSDECSRVSWVFFSSDNAYFVGESEYRAMANRAYAALLECTSYAEMKKIVARYTLNLSNDEIENGFCLSSVGGIGTSDRELCRRAAELSPLEISEIIETEDGLYILIGLNKSTSYYESHYEEIYDLCLENKLYSAIDSAATEMLASAAFTDTFRALTPADFFGEAAQ